MMGGGFGGCTINLVAEEALVDVKETIKQHFESVTGNLPEFHTVKIGDGTHIMEQGLRNAGE